MKLVIGLICLVLWTGIRNVSATGYEEVIYYHNDALGSPVVATDANGDVKWREEYSPYGSRLLHESREVDLQTATQIESPWDEKQWFTGKLEETPVGIQYFGARWYEPEIGRFLSVDPVLFNEDNIFSFNRYAYANSNPYRFVDPDGRSPRLAWQVGLSLGVGLDAVVYGITGVALTTYVVDAAWTALHNESSDNSEERPDNGNTNPYDGPIDGPVIVVDNDGNAILLETGEQVNSSPNSDYQQVIGANGKPTGDRLDRGGHRNQSDPKAQDPHAHRPGVSTPDGNPHLPINPRKS